MVTDHDMPSRRPATTITSDDNDRRYKSATALFNEIYKSFSPADHGYKHVLAQST